MTDSPECTERGRAGPYAEGMTVSARDIAVALRARLPGLPVKKLHKLLYYCQGHHLAHFGTPLFEETVSAWDMGPVVGQLWYDERQGHEPVGSRALEEAELNTVGYVVSRYGKLTGRDLEHLTHAEGPWRRADTHRSPSGSARIELTWLLEWFSHENRDEEELSGLLDTNEVTAWLEGAEARRSSHDRPDDLDLLRARLTRGA